ncbi:MAG TPA: hypothetical protein VJQ45_05260 [Ktedonobacterales bacterium]|nr:hypothetical protein [Ktedonobacterales bacterium]
MASSPPPGAQVAQPDVATASSMPNLAQISQILGILSCIPAVGILFCIPAIVCGHLSLRRAQADSGAQAADRTRALWGLALGYVIVVLYLWLAVGLFVAPMLSGS